MLISMHFCFNHLIPNCAQVLKCSKSVVLNRSGTIYPRGIALAIELARPPKYVLLVRGISEFLSNKPQLSKNSLSFFDQDLLTLFRLNMPVLLIVCDSVHNRQCIYWRLFGYHDFCDLRIYRIYFRALLSTLMKLEYNNIPRCR